MSKRGRGGTVRPSDVEKIQVGQGNGEFILHFDQDLFNRNTDGTLHPNDKPRTERELRGENKESKEFITSLLYCFDAITSIRFGRHKIAVHVPATSIGALWPHVDEIIKKYCPRARIGMS